VSVKLTYATSLTVDETLETNVPAANWQKKTVRHDGWNTAESLTDVTPVHVSLHAAFVATIAGGLCVLDLTALPGTNGVAVNGTGKKVQAVKFKAPAANVGPVAFAMSAVNGFPIVNGESKFGLLPGQELVFFGNEKSEEISPTMRLVDVIGNSGDMVYVQVVLG
jgi:hypothetical protein